MTEVYLALGSNVGDSKANIEQAVQLLSSSIKDIRQAPIYRSKAVGVTDQPDFLNTAISGQTELIPAELLKFIKDVETRIGRIDRGRWQPREIDIDIIFYGSQVIKTHKLTVPHPRFRERDFVLQPLHDLNPNLIDPVTNQAIKQLLADLSPDQLSISELSNS